MNLLNLSTTVSEELTLVSLGINLVFSAILSIILSLYYIKYGKTLTNRASLGKDFTMISLTTTLIITIVKSSLALSLGLVGALSIVRFRAAIKEPEELAYLFLAIGIGLGFGADQAVLTIFSFAVILLVIYLRNEFTNEPDSQNLYLNFDIEGNCPDDALEKVSQLLVQNTKRVDLKRVVKNRDSLHVTFLVDFSQGIPASKILNDLTSIHENACVTFIDQSRFFKV